MESCKMFVSEINKLVLQRWILLHLSKIIHCEQKFVTVQLFSARFSCFFVRAVSGDLNGKLPTLPVSKMKFQTSNILWSTSINSKSISIDVLRVLSVQKNLKQSYRLRFHLSDQFCHLNQFQVEIRLFGLKSDEMAGEDGKPPHESACKLFH